MKICEAFLVNKKKKNVRALELFQAFKGIKHALFFFFFLPDLRCLC